MIKLLVKRDFFYTGIPMKPKDLKCPFRWQERRPILHNRVLFVPEYYEEHKSYSFPKWQDPELFGNSSPVCIEYCSGNGDWIIEKAKQHKETNWVAVEQRFDRVRKIWSKMQNNNIQNLLIVCGEALTFSKDYLGHASVNGIFINFPDPWPKRTHAKHRLIRTPFVDEITRLITPKGTMTLVTDDATYCQQMVDVVLENPSWHSAFPKPHYVLQWEGYGSSYFDALWRQKGKEIHYLNFIRNDG